MKLVKYVGASALGAALLGMLFVAQTSPVKAADHTDPPQVVGTGPVDIGDLYAYSRGAGASQSLVMVLTFGGPLAPVTGQAGSFDDDVLYEIHIDRAGVGTDNQPDDTIDVRFGQNDLGNWGVRAVGIPGTSGPLVGNVETTLTDNDVRLFAGLRDDPFFFDLDGFLETLNTGALSFDNTNDSFAGSNITAIVVEVPMAAVSPNGETLNIWATTGTRPFTFTP